MVRWEGRGRGEGIRREEVLGFGWDLGGLVGGVVCEGYGGW